MNYFQTDFAIPRTFLGTNGLLCFLFVFFFGVKRYEPNIDKYVYGTEWLVQNSNTTFCKLKADFLYFRNAKMSIIVIISKTEVKVGGLHFLCNLKRIQSHLIKNFVVYLLVVFWSLCWLVEDVNIIISNKELTWQVSNIYKVVLRPATHAEWEKAENFLENLRCKRKGHGISCWKNGIKWETLCLHVVAVLSWSSDRRWKNTRKYTNPWRV